MLVLIVSSAGRPFIDRRRYILSMRLIRYDISVSSSPLSLGSGSRLCLRRSINGASMIVIGEN